MIPLIHQYQNETPEILSPPPPSSEPLPVGTILPFAGHFPPLGWLFCDGLTVLIQDYPDLYQVIGDLYGGDGETLFALPDCRGRTLVGSGTGVGLVERNAGETFGAERILLDAAHMPFSGLIGPSDSPPASYFTSQPDSEAYSLVTGRGEGIPLSQPSLAIHYIVWSGNSEEEAVPEVTVYTTVSSGSETQDVAFVYSVNAGDVMISLLLFAIVVLMMLNFVLRVHEMRRA